MQTILDLFYVLIQVQLKQQRHPYSKQLREVILQPRRLILFHRKIILLHLIS